MNAHMVNDGSHEAPWQFELGAWITHKDQSMPSLVLSRFRAGNAKGNKLELYGVRSFAANDPHRDRLMVGDSLKPIDDAAKSICLAHATGLVDGSATV
ncbi:hypothetical protein [Allomesorhizobium camelthorni]|uniref:Uncharacterized protein n=1 Tax=Allomesorhizobium camelthorni TaxID=475069 RepID=A0A6G4WJB1_9HYPH|nr:hypothetical protein [Mesorhizobium camelthorni]NGO54210.1 hypothetical protein [Mesorhizobium camelthorni]